METMRLAPDREETSIKEGRLVDAATGIRVPIPENWSAGIIHGMANVVGTCDAPDLQTSISVFAMNVPVELSAKAIARAGTASQKRFGAEVKVLSQGDTQLAGEKAYQMRTKITLGDIAMRSHQVFRVDKRNGNRTLYALSYSSFSPTGLDDFQAQFDEVTEGLEIVEPVQQALPPEVGTVADGRYINREY